MIVFVDSTGEAALRDAEDFTRFKVVREASLSRNTDAVAFDGEGHAWVSIAFLRAYGQARDAPQWLEQLDGMIAYAGRKGWLNPDSTRIRAHIEDM